MQTLNTIGGTEVRVLHSPSRARSQSLSHQVYQPQQTQGLSPTRLSPTRTLSPTRQRFCMTVDDNAQERGLNYTEIVQQQQISPRNNYSISPKQMIVVPQQQSPVVHRQAPMVTVSQAPSPMMRVGTPQLQQVTVGGPQNHQVVLNSPSRQRMTTVGSPSHAVVGVSGNDWLDGPTAGAVASAEEEHRVQIIQQYVQRNYDLAAWDQKERMDLVSKTTTTTVTQNVGQARPFWGMKVVQSEWVDGPSNVQSEWVDGPAYNAGVRPGDKITHINGRSVSTEADMLGAQQNSRVGTPVNVSTISNGQTVERTIFPGTTDPTYSQFSEYYNTTTGRQMEYQAPVVVQEQPNVTRAAPFWGMTVVDPEMNVDSIWENGPAWDAGVRPGDKITHVDNKSVSSKQDMINKQVTSKVGTPVKVSTISNGQKTERTMWPMTTGTEYRGMKEYFEKTQNQQRTYQAPVVQQPVVQQGPDVKQARPFWGMAVDSTRTVTSEWENGPAWKAGVRPGDKITHINGAEMRDEKHVQEQQMMSKIGTPVSVSTVVDGKQVPRTIQPMTTDETFKQFPEYYTKTQQHKYAPGPDLKLAPPFWGMKAAEQATVGGPKSLWVESLWEGAPAYNAGIRPNDKITHINGLQMNSKDDIINQQKASAVGSSVAVTTDKGTRNIVTGTMKPEYSATPYFYSKTGKKEISH